MIEREAESRQVFSRRTHGICLVCSLLVYGLVLVAINRSGLLAFAPLTLSASDQLPLSSVEGTLHFSKGGRNRSGGIVVRLKEGGIATVLCRGVDRERFPRAIPCRAEEFAQIDGRAGRLWYVERTSSNRLLGNITSRLAVQLLVYPDRLYPFNEEKAALAAAEERARHSPLLFLLRALMHCLGLLAVLVLSWGVADKVLALRSRRTAPPAARP